MGKLFNKYNRYYRLTQRMKNAHINVKKSRLNGHTGSSYYRYYTPEQAKKHGYEPYVRYDIRFTLYEAAKAIGKAAPMLFLLAR